MSQDGLDAQLGLTPGTILRCECGDIQIDRLSGGAIALAEWFAVRGRWEDAAGALCYAERRRREIRCHAH